MKNSRGDSKISLGDNTLYKEKPPELFDIMLFKSDQFIEDQDAIQEQDDFVENDRRTKSAFFVNPYKYLKKKRKFIADQQQLDVKKQ